MRSNTQHRFSEVPQVNIPRSTFDRSASYKTTFDAGYLVPVFVDEALPGDTFKVDMTGFARLSTPTYPIMDNMFLDTFFFAVPIRIIQDNWKKLMGEQVDPGDSIAFSAPTVTLNNVANESLYDYLGCPTKIAANYSVNNHFARAYNLIWNDWFRDENLQDSVVVDKDDGPDTATDYVLLRRGKRHDYFTSALPWLQKGDAVSLSLGTEAPLTGIGWQNTGAVASFTLRETGGTSRVVNGYQSTIRDIGIEEDPSNALYPAAYADLANATASTVNELRQAIQVQRLLEKDARGGTRYIEIVKNHFGVTSDDARMQRPEYLGGGTTPINITPIARTDSSPGALGAMGTTGFRRHGFVKSFTEHCVILGLACIRADLHYQEGLDKMFSRSTRYDWYFPTLAHLGEQAIYNKEIYLDAATIGAGTDDDVFGYQERYAEYRYKPSKITGKMRSNDAATLDAWHLGIEFGSLPTLDDSFIQENPPVDRVIVTPTEPHFIFDSYSQIYCTRPMPIYSVPGYIDHF